MSRAPHRRAWLAAALLCAASGLGSAGCAVTDMAEEAWFQTTQSLRADGTAGYRDDTDEPTEDWSEVREIGRAGQVTVEDDEDWYRKWFMSAKARDIEKNLGFD